MVATFGTTSTTQHKSDDHEATAPAAIAGVFVSSADKAWLANLTHTIVTNGRIPTMHRGEKVILFSPDDCTLFSNGSVVPPTDCAGDPRDGCKAGSNCYADSYVRDSTYGITFAPEFYEMAAVRAAAETFLNVSQTCGHGALKVVEAILPGPPICTPGFNCGINTSFGCPDNNAFMLKLAAFYATEWHDDDWLCAHESALAAAYTWARRLRGPEALSVGQYGFMDCVGVSGNNLFMSLLFVEGARAIAAALARAKCKDLTIPLANYTAEAARTSGAIGLLFDETVGMFKATDQHDNQTDIWGSVFAVSLGAGSVEHRAAVVEYVTTNHAIVFAWGQVRHLPFPQSWHYAATNPSRTGNNNMPGNFQNGGYWALPVSWALQAVAKKDPALATKLLADCLSDFKQNGIWEWANWTVPLPADRVGHPNYIASATAVHSFVRDFVNVREDQPAPIRIKNDDRAPPPYTGSLD